jgi:hypothetical protein
MKLPNIYLAPGEVQVVELSRFFVDGENLVYNASVADADIATCAVDGSRMTVTGVAEGFTTIKVTVDGKMHDVHVTVRNGANSNGWM